jgi:hypothetical protein
MSNHTHQGICSDADPCLVCFELGQAIERKSIIKVLENRLKEVLVPDGSLYIESMVLKQLIKVIGENK